MFGPCPRHVSPKLRIVDCETMVRRDRERGLACLGGLIETMLEEEALHPSSPDPRPWVRTPVSKGSRMVDPALTILCMPRKHRQHTVSFGCCRLSAEGMIMIARGHCRAPRRRNASRLRDADNRTLVWAVPSV
jgi:hypothetical protein